MKDRLYAVKVVGRRGHQADNEYWPIGSYIQSIQLMTWTVGPCKLARADLFQDEFAAVGLLNFAMNQYPEIDFRLVCFVEK